ncbi:Ig-like domain-containing protein, partial [Halomonas elongata]|uniref:Ig-like domain-containing protein n=1 Tax=Halomonas elongata TaxID=2746 RepID=UPI003D187E0D
MIVKTSSLNDEVSQFSGWDAQDELVLTSPRKVAIQLTPEEVLTMTREGNDLVIETVDGRTFKLSDFYANTGETGDGQASGQTPVQNELYLVDEEGELLKVSLSSAGADGLVQAQYVPQGEMAGFEMMGAEPVDEGGGGGGSFVPIAILGGAGAIGLAAAAGGGGSGGGGRPDETPPEPPVDVSLGGEGRVIEGRGEPGTTVTVTGPDGEVVGDGTVNDDGSFEFELDEPQSNGENLDVALTDGAGNESDPTSVTAPDTTAPEMPTLTLSANDDGTVTASGEAEPGSNVTVTFPDGTTTDVEVGEDGSFETTSEASQSSGEVSATATDAAGNESDPAVAEYADTIAPEAPTLNVVANDDGTVTASGESEAGSTVTVAFPDGTTGEVVAGDDGSFEATSDGAQPSGEVSATATDAAGNESDPAVVEYTDTIAPEAPVLVLANDTGTDGDGITSDGTVNVGNLEDGATWEYSTDGGSSWTVGSGSSFTVPEGDYATGDVLARQTDEAGNTSDNGELGAVTVDASSPGGDDGTDAPTLTIAEADDGFVSA